jgi:hypothetical protein
MAPGVRSLHDGSQGGRRVRPSFVSTKKDGESEYA